MKTIKMKNKELLEKINGIQSVLSKQLPVIATYKLSKNIEEINKELKAYRETRAKIEDKYCKKDDKGANVLQKNGLPMILPAKQKQFDKDIEELLNIETSLKTEQIKLGNLGNKVDISVPELDSIKFMIEDY